MNRTTANIHKLLAALPAPGYDLGILNDRGMHRLEAVSHSRILRMIPYLQYRNVSGAHIYFRPTGESSYTLLDDLSQATLAALTAPGYSPAAVVETSPGNYQAWLRHNQPLEKELGTLAAQVLAARFRADRSAADWRRFGRMPGFTNRKPQHRTPEGLYPFARLVQATGLRFPESGAFHTEIIALAQKQEAERLQARSHYAARPRQSSASLTLARFRCAPKYVGRPAAADMAFAIAACAHGWPEHAIATELAADYLSRDGNRRRREAYIHRTLTKAKRWAT